MAWDATPIGPGPEEVRQLVEAAVHIGIENASMECLICLEMCTLIRLPCGHAACHACWSRLWNSDKFGFCFMCRQYQADAIRSRAGQ